MSNSIQPSYDTNRQVLGKILPLKAPFTVILDSSEVCNFKCSYCFRSNHNNKEIWGYARDSKLMDWDTFTLAVEQIKEFQEEVMQISLSNHGEPLCHPELPRMIRYIKEQGIKSRVSIHTNASLLTEELAHELHEVGLDRMVISMQGLSAEKYVDVCEVQIDFDQFLKNIEILYANKQNLQIHVKILDLALDEGQEDIFYDMFSKMADRVFIEKEVPIWKGKKSAADADQEVQNKYGECFEEQKMCPLIFHTLVVTPNGDVYPCTQLLRKEVLGNIRQDSLRSMWDGEYRKKLLIEQCEDDIPAICKGCYIRQNSIYSVEDMIDKYRDEIKQRLL